MQTRRAICFGLLLARVFTFCAVAHAQEDRFRLQWPETYRRFTPAEYVIAGTALVASGALRLVTDTYPEARFRGGLPLDEPVRDALRLRRREDRLVAAQVSDWLWYISQGFPVLIDGLFVPLATDRGHLDVAWQITAMNYEAYGVAGVLVSLSHLIVGRERPSGFACDRDVHYDPLCRARGRFAGFLSGHTQMAATGAGLTCAHHQYLPLFGGGAWDVVACASVSAVALATGLLRIMSDRHYLSDVVLSAALGFAIGYGLPVLLHYRGASPPEKITPTLRGSATAAPSFSFGGTW